MSSNNLDQLERLYGKPAASVADDYTSPEEYAGQGDTRVIRDLQFSYLSVSGFNADGSPILQPVDVRQNTEVKIEDIGQIALEKGERNHSFFTDKELERLNRGGSPAAPVSGASNVSELGPHELAEWLKTGKDGSAFTIDEVLEEVGSDKDLAQRMLEAENIATDGDARAGLHKGLTVIIERENQ